LGGGAWPEILLLKRYYIRVSFVSNSPILFAIYLVVYGVVGMVIGALTGLLASLVTGYGSKWILKDGFLGWIGLVAGFFGCTPWPRYAVVVAIVVAVLLPALHEVDRFARARTDRTREN
jgi:hypothetical protein